MKIAKLHDWNMSYAEARDLQRELADRVSRYSELAAPALIAGIDVSAFRRQNAVAAVTVLRYPGLQPVEIATAAGVPLFPYIPGLLSFRESPVVLDAFTGIKNVPHLVLVDGHGLAHPRRFGIACHLGLWLDLPTIGCAKSLLCGKYEEPSCDVGSWTEITDNGEVIGAAVRTRTGIKPVFVSIGHKVDLPASIKWVLNACRGFRLPEPLRLAHIAAGEKSRQRP